MYASSRLAMTSGIGSNMPIGMGRGLGVIVTDVIFIGWLVGLVFLFRWKWKTKRPPRIPQLGKDP